MLGSHRTTFSPTATMNYTRLSSRGEVVSFTPRRRTRTGCYLSSPQYMVSEGEQRIRDKYVHADVAESVAARVVRRRASLLRAGHQLAQRQRFELEAAIPTPFTREMLAKRTAANLDAAAAMKLAPQFADIDALRERQAEAAQAVRRPACTTAALAAKVHLPPIGMLANPPLSSPNGLRDKQRLHALMQNDPELASPPDPATPASMSKPLSLGALLARLSEAGSLKLNADAAARYEGSPPRPMLELLGEQILKEQGIHGIVRARLHALRESCLSGAYAANPFVSLFAQMVGWVGSSSGWPQSQVGGERWAVGSGW